MQQIVWNKTLIHCSSLSKLFTEPQAKAAKEAGELSATAKTHLIETYIREKYGRHKEIETKQMRKGTNAEGDSLLLLSEYLGEYLEKNEENVYNSHIIGTPDAYLGENINQAEQIFDVKSSYDIFTFLANASGELNKDYYYQIQGYLWLSGAELGYIAYCLVDLPQDQLEYEKMALIRKLGAISEESPDFIREWKKKENLFLYSDIDESERILLFKVEKDPDFPEKCAAKIEKARQFLFEFERKHLNFNK